MRWSWRLLLEELGTCRHVCRVRQYLGIVYRVAWGVLGCFRHCDVISGYLGYPTNGRIFAPGLGQGWVIPLEVRVRGTGVPIPHHLGGIGVKSLGHGRGD